MLLRAADPRWRCAEAESWLSVTSPGGSITPCEPSSNTITPPSGSHARAARGPLRIAALAWISASSALGASAVTCTMPVNAGRAGRGVQQVMGRAAVGVQPAAPADAARRHAAAPQRRTCAACCRRTGCATSTGRARAARAADRQVAGAVDREARVPGQLLGEHVGEQALGQAAAVELRRRAAA